MHGIKRTRLTDADREARKQKERSKIEEFTKLTDAALSKKKSQDWSRESFDLTTRLLQVNPEFYTIWNYRRDIMVNGLFANSPPEAVKDMLMDDLVMTMSALKAHPKVYWIWNHRRWCLEAIPNGPGVENSDTFTAWKQSAWEKELFVVEKMLDADPRNFHAWDYRRYILSGMPVARSEFTELTYTSQKIGANFSNFSAWHQRSKTLASLWQSGKLEEAKSREQEFELLRNAMYTDPNDQSVWMYHRWLVGTDERKEILEQEISAIQELLEEQPDSKWCIESMVHYKSLLVKKFRTDVDAELLSQEIRSLLVQLQELDPSRKRRYQDLAQQLD
ncbi:hypothetical protein D9613_002906 [Agrocybe pediades]|uniref:Geranylgeranyl transferase type-2 subunit alpha n=1 Tax=Agrocybe pediades TaxID=84607 RepID=A0A8H4QP12_9AGAR|nr:hypothetical protein D9613_002906 [Agrocybe pediades]